MEWEEDAGLVPPAEQFHLSSEHQCPECAYSLAGLREPVCPECGYTCTAEELKGAVRRSVFLELTRYGQFGGIFVTGFAFWMLFYFTRYVFPSLILLLVLAIGTLAMSGYFVIPVMRQFPTMYRPIVRRIWMSMMPWWNAWWIVPIPVLALIGVIEPRWIASRNTRWDYTLWTYGWLVVGALVACGFTLTLAAWALRWRGLARAAGLSERWNDPDVVRPSLWPFFRNVMCALIAVVSVLGIIALGERFS